MRAGKKPKLSETDRERVWEKVNFLMYRVHHGQPSLEEIVSCLTEYDKSRPLRDFITSWAVRWLGGIELKKRGNVRGQSRRVIGPSASLTRRQRRDAGGRAAVRGRLLIALHDLDQCRLTPRAAQDLKSDRQAVAHEAHGIPQSLLQRADQVIE